MNELHLINIVKEISKLSSESLYNKDGIPIGVVLTGKHKSMPKLIVGINKYHIDDRWFTSLSSAAKAITSKETNGWTFWETKEGVTVDKKYRIKK